VPKTVADGVVEELLGDLEQLGKLLESLGPTPFVIRSYVRTIFSVLDAWSFHTKQKAYVHGESKGIAFTKAELEFIFEQRATKSKGSSSALKPKNIPTADNVRFAIELSRRIYPGEPPPYDGELPREFETVRRLRNRITHPKLAADLAIVGQDATNSGRVLLWLLDQMRWQSRSERAYIDQMRNGLQQSSERLRREIVGHGAVKPFEGSIQELYTAPRLSKKK